MAPGCGERQHQARHRFGGRVGRYRHGKTTLALFQCLAQQVGRTAFNAKGNDVAIETLTLTCERVEIA